MTQQESNETARALAVYHRLGETYGIRPWARRREPLHELISTILSHRTNGANEEKAFTQLWARFGSWQAIAAAPAEQIAQEIAPANYPEVKAPRIKAVLQRIIAERGAASIDFLGDLPPDAAMAWLTSLPGVGPKTATLVLLFCFHVPLLPVDTHVHRVSGRIGLIPASASAELAHDLLLGLLPPDADLLWNFHHNMLRHGQRICTWAAPKCERCPLREICDYGQAVGVPQRAQ
ncbi:MAG: endonuclease III [Roseiflexaceae bacterium]|nr:endonuclease III [Roseiflexaceae bacterium]